MLVYTCKQRQNHTPHLCACTRTHAMQAGEGACGPAVPRGAPCTTFATALTVPSITTIVLTTDVALSATVFSGLASIDKPYVLGRDLTICTLLGSDHGPMQALDFGYLQGLVVMGPGVTLTFVNTRIMHARWVPHSFRGSFPFECQVGAH